MQGIPTRLMLTAAVAYGALRTLSIVSPDVANSPWRLHGADVLAPLVLIPLFAWLQVLWGLRCRQQALGAGEITTFVIVFSLVYELFLPALSSRMVGDPLDVVAYAIGGAVLWGVPRVCRRGQLRHLSRSRSVAGLHLRTAGSRR